MFAVVDWPSNLGLRPSGVETLPAALRQAGLVASLRARDAGRVPQEAEYNSERPNDTGAGSIGLESPKLHVRVDPDRPQPAGEASRNLNPGANVSVMVILPVAAWSPAFPTLKKKPLSLPTRATNPSAWKLISMVRSGPLFTITVTSAEPTSVPHSTAFQLMRIVVVPPLSAVTVKICATTVTSSAGATEAIVGSATTAVILALQSP